jgi:methyl-accepting chemotaxis protein
VPGWVQAVLSAAALVTAAGVLWAKVLHPLIRAAATGEVMLPILQELTVKFRDVPGIFDVLKDMASQFRTDNGSSLRDVVNALEASLANVHSTIEKAEHRALAAAQFLQVGLDVDRKMDERDREQLSRIVREMDRLADRLERLEEGAEVVADNLAVAKTAVEGVAADLAAAHDRADDSAGPTGAAADAAAQTPEVAG